MGETPLIEKIWESLAKKVKKVPGGLRLVEKMKETYLAEHCFGQTVKNLGGGPAYKKAVEMLAADIEYQSSSERQRRAAEKRKLKEKEFWLTIREETGLDEDSDLAFDPLRMRVVHRQKKAQHPDESRQASLDGYKDLIAAALYDPLTASKMVNDPFFKFQEIKQMANAITDGDFKPKLRTLMQEWIRDPFKARQSQELLSQEAMPQWLIEIAKKLGQRKKWNLN